MIRSLFLIALMAVLSFATPFSEHGKLSVVDGKIVDKNGNPYVLRGMSMFWNTPGWPGATFYKQSTVTSLAGSSWNANVVRAAIGRSDGSAIGDGDVQDAKNFIDWTAQAGIYVIIDWHYHDLKQNEATSFFRTVSDYAKGKGHVLYEVFNEPISQSWSSIKSYAEAIIDVIRANDSDGLIIVGNPNYSSDLSSPMATPIAASKARNVLYTLHFYTSDPTHNVYQSALKNAHCTNFPVFASEWGTSQADGGGAQDWTLTNGWMSLVETLGISWANWSIVDKGESSAALSSGCCGGGTFGDNNLTASGKYVQAIMKARNNGGAITSANGSNNVNLSQVNIDCGSAAQEVEKTGKVVIGGGATNAVDFVPNSMSGAKDSATVNSAPTLQNTAGTVTVSYKLTNIPGPDNYRIRLRYGAASAVSVSLQGDGIGSTSAELASTGGTSTWKNSDYITITVTASGETQIKLTFTAGAANSFVFANILATTEAGTTPPPLPSSSSSSDGDTPIISVAQSVTSNGALAIKNGINLQVVQKATIEVFGLDGKSVRKMNFSNGSYYVSLGDLPKGLYIVKVKFDNRSEILRIPVR